MQLSAFDQLQIAATAGDDAIRAAYLALVSANPPDKYPARFEEIRQAYEQIATKEARLNYALFESPVLGLSDLLIKLMERTQAADRLPSGELLKSLLKDTLYVK